MITIEYLLLTLTGVNIVLLGASAVLVWSVAYRAYIEHYGKFSIGFASLGIAFGLQCVRRVTALELMATNGAPISNAARLDQIWLPLAISVLIFLGISTIGRAYAEEMTKRRGQGA